MFWKSSWNRVAFRKVTKQGSIAMLPSKNGNFLMVRSGSFEFLAECLHCYRCHQWKTWGRVFGDPPLHTDITFCLVPSIFRHAPTSSSSSSNLASSHLLLGSFSNDDGDGNQTSKKQYVYDAKPSLHNYDVKMPNCKFYGGRKQATTNLFFSL